MRFDNNWRDFLSLIYFRGYRLAFSFLPPFRSLLKQHFICTFDGRQTAWQGVQYIKPTHNPIAYDPFPPIYPALNILPVAAVDGRAIPHHKRKNQEPTKTTNKRKLCRYTRWVYPTRSRSRTVLSILNMNNFAPPPRG